MRATNFLILWLFLGVTCKSQAYIPLPDSNACWSVVWAMPSPEYYSQHYEYFLNGDTLINNLEYNKIFKLELNVNCSKDTFYNIYSGAYRNDTISQQVHFIPSGSQAEQLLYDFSLSVGDIYHKPGKTNYTQIW